MREGTTDDGRLYLSSIVHRRIPQNGGQDMNDTNQGERRSQIAALLIQTGAEHDKYEQSALGGQYDVEWPKWYASYLVESGLPDLLGRGLNLDKDKIEELLKKADASHRATAPNYQWADYYAQYFLEILHEE